MNYFVDTDNDAHWYVVPDELRDVWNEWLDLDDEDPDSWDVPDGVVRIPGHPSLIVFPSYEPT
jgi:hypothetical protein